MADIPRRLKSKSYEWYTPDKILDPVRAYFGGRIPLDPATSEDNPTRAARFYTEKTDGLHRPWRLPAFVNPPYGRVFPAWAAKIQDEGRRGQEVIALLPCGARFSTGYFQDFLGARQLRAVCFLKGRVSFQKPFFHQGKRCGYVPERGNMYDSAIYGFNVDGDRFRDAFAELGAVWILRRR